MTVKNIVYSKIKFNTILNLFSYLSEIKFFLQVGSHDGEMHDPIQKFVLKNKSAGLLIEPQIEMLKKCRNKYKNIQNLIFYNAAIYHENKKIKLYKIENEIDYSHTGWASVLPDRFDNTVYDKNVLYEIVQGIPLDLVLKRFKIKKIDLLQIDTEGYDYDILKLFNFYMYRPKLIQMEHIHLKSGDLNKAVDLLNQQNYRVLEKKNDLIAIDKKYLKISYFFAYFFLRLSESLSSRLNFVLNKILNK